MLEKASKSGTTILKKGFSVFLSAIMATTFSTNTFAMKSAKKKQKEDDELKPHMTRRYVRDELINEMDIAMGDLDSAVTRVFDEKEKIYSSEFVLADVVRLIIGRAVAAITSPVN